MEDLINILSLLGIPGDKVKSLQTLSDKESGITTILLELVDSRDSCPYCHETEKIGIKDYYHVTINDSVVQHWNIVVDIRMRRYVCKNCGRTYKQSFSFYKPRARISITLHQTIVESLKDTKTFVQIAKECSVSPTEVLNIFDTLPRQPRLNFTDVLCIDEFHFVKKKKLIGNYPAVLSNPFSSNIIDIIESRQMAFLRDYFNSIPYSERKKIKYFISDMNETFRQIKNAFFHDAVHIVDHFHIMKLFSEAIQRIRINIMKSEDYKSKEYIYLKKNWKLFMMDRSKLVSYSKADKKTGVI